MIWDLFKKLASDRPAEETAARGRWLVAGLGNPGDQYAETRHNAGFMVVEHLAKRHHITAKNEGKFNAMVGTGRMAGVPVVLTQPLTFMNLSGEAVAPLLKYYDIPPERLLVIYDDAALPFGKIRIRSSGSAGGQNGMRSIIKHLGGNEQFPRLRVGIGAPEGQRPLKSHVLSKFVPEERPQLAVVLDASADAVEMALREGVEAAMNRFNGMAIE